MKALLCRPEYFGVEYEINPWMHVDSQPNSSKAKQQWGALCKALEESGVELVFIEPLSGKPDMVFTANGGLLKGNKVVLPNFRYPERQGERGSFETWFKEQGYEILTLPEEYPFEGEGDALFCGEKLFAGYFYRTHLAAHHRLGELLDTEVISLQLINPEFYHLDTCFFPIQADLALYYPNAFDEYGQRLLRTHFQNLIPLTKADATAFCCNGIHITKRLLLPQGSRELKHQLTELGFEITYLDFSEFLKAGGAAKCLTLWLDSKSKKVDSKPY